MKGTRREAIIEIIHAQPVTTQDELLHLLEAQGYTVTQATVSRDIKSLRLSKVTGADGSTRYAMPAVAAGEPLDKFRTIFRESVISVAVAGNIVVVKCYTGLGNAACAAIDAIGLDHVVGTIAGDDTIFAAVDTAEDAYKLRDSLNRLLG